MIDKRIGIIGCGNMGEALFSRLAQVVEKSTRLMVSEQDVKRRDELQTKYKIIVEIDNLRLFKYSDVIILAVKPKDFERLLKDEICCCADPKKLVISIAAGITTQYIEKVLGKDVPVIRAMPNTPALVGEAMTVITPGVAASKEDLRIAREIFETIGKVIEADESDMDAVTAISGSGPAYFFYLIESMVAGAVKLGLDRKTAMELVGQTAIGSAKLLAQTGDDPADLRLRVTSKGGTTEAAIKIFETKKIRQAVAEAVKMACRRSKELRAR